MFFLTPKYVKQGRLYIKEARKRVAYNRDRWNPEVTEAFELEIPDEDAEKITTVKDAVDYIENKTAKK